MFETFCNRFYDGRELLRNVIFREFYILACLNTKVMETNHVVPKISISSRYVVMLEL